MYICICMDKESYMMYEKHPYFMNVKNRKTDMDLFTYLLIFIFQFIRIFISKVIFAEHTLHILHSPRFPVVNPFAPSTQRVAALFQLAILVHARNHHERCRRNLPRILGLWHWMCHTGCQSIDEYKFMKDIEGRNGRPSDVIEQKQFQKWDSTCSKHVKTKYHQLSLGITWLTLQ